MNLANLLLRSANRTPNAPAVCHGPQVVQDYRTLASRAAMLAASLTGKLGLRPGERVALAAKNTTAYLELLYACWIAGLVAVPMNAKLHAREFAYMISDSSARLCFLTGDLSSALDQALKEVEMEQPPGLIEIGSRDYEALFAGATQGPHECGPDELAWLFYTSGTTGRPKGAMLSHRNLLTMTLCYFADVDEIGPGEAILHAAPMSHGSGLYHLPYLVKGGRQVVPESAGFEPSEIFDLLESTEKLSLFAAPTMVKRLVEAPEAGESDSRNLKTVVYGGGPMYLADLKQAMDCFGDKFVQIYGQAESPMTITALGREVHRDHSHPRYEERLASVGQAQSAVELRIADADDRGLPPGELGEVLVRGPSVTLGYWMRPEATAETLRGGWLHTGDMGVLDEDGFLTLKDRSKDVIISGGSNIYPREVEEVLLRHESVQECSVIGLPHPDWGEEVVAVVVTRPGRSVTTEALDQLCLAEIARFKRPKSYRFVEALPKNNYGKVLKTELRKSLLEASPEGDG